MKSTSCVARIAVLSAVALTTFDARAEDEITKLEKSLADEHAALSTADCSEACRALASIRRAADKICALEPGARCSAARAKAEDATRRVRDACAQCAIATTLPPPPVPAPAPDTAAPMKAGRTPNSAPPRGGCASCDVGGASPADGAAAAMALLALTRVLRRRKKLTPGR